MIIYLELIAFFSFFPRFSRQASSWFNELEVGLYSRSYFAVLGSRREENGLRRRQLQLKFVGFDVMVSSYRVLSGLHRGFLASHNTATCEAYTGKSVW